MSKRKKLIIILLACLLTACIGLTAVNTVQIASMKAKIAGMEYDIGQLEYLAIDGMGLLDCVYESLPYRLYVPEGAGRKYPLVLYLHGAGSRQGSNNRSQVMGNSFIKRMLSEEVRAGYPCILLAPQCPDGMGWVRQPWGPGIATDLMGMLEQVCTEYPVDRSRIYITGVSMGGFGTWGMLRAYPDYFAAAVPICGGWDLDDDVENAPVMKGVPIWAFHGALDTAVPVERTRGMVQALEAVGGDVKYTEYPEEGHGIGTRVYYEPELLPWMFAQRRGEAEAVDPVKMMRAAAYIDSTKASMPYRIYVPDNLDPEAKIPLVLCLHGSGNRGDDNLAQLGMSSAVHTLLTPENREQYPCIILAPQCPEEQRWVRGIGQYDLPGNTERLMGLLEQTKAAYPVDETRIYITGLSMGGFGTWGMLKAYPDYFAAAVPICGGWNLEEDPETAPLFKNVPIWAFHGALDDDVPVERTRDMVRALEAVGGNVTYTEYPDGLHPIWDRVYREPELFPWMFAQARGVD